MLKNGLFFIGIISFMIESLPPYIGIGLIFMSILSAFHDSFEEQEEKYKHLYYCYFLRCLELEYHKYKAMINAKVDIDFEEVGVIDFSKCPFYVFLLLDIENIIPKEIEKIKPETIKMMIRQSQAAEKYSLSVFFNINKWKKQHSNLIEAPEIQGRLEVLRCIQEGISYE